MPAQGRDASRAAASRGGRANEAGSLYRSGIAAYLAAHGLAGRGVEAAGYPESRPAPVTLSFETAMLWMTSAAVSLMALRSGCRRSEHAARTRS